MLPIVVEAALNQLREVLRLEQPFEPRTEPVGLAAHEEIRPANTLEQRAPVLDRIGGLALPEALDDPLLELPSSASVPVADLRQLGEDLGVGGEDLLLERGVVSVQRRRSRVLRDWGPAGVSEWGIIILVLVLVLVLVW